MHLPRNIHSSFWDNQIFYSYILYYAFYLSPPIYLYLKFQKDTEYTE